MKVLVLGATGATGKWLVRQLLEDGNEVRAVVRNPEKLLSLVGKHKKLHLFEGAVLAMSQGEIKELVSGSNAIASCLGHNLSFKGLFGKPRRLVRDSLKRLCLAAIQANQKTRVVLMNTSGNSNRDLREKRSLAHKVVVFLLRYLLPPHADNEQAAEFLRTEIGPKHSCIEWVVVRPDGLTEANEVSAYENHTSPIRDPIFNAGQVSRINVAHFMTKLITENDMFKQWQGQMPLIYNKDR